jgi:hypothetical protein
MWIASSDGSTGWKIEREGDMGHLHRNALLAQANRREALIAEGVEPDAAKRMAREVVKGEIIQLSPTTAARGKAKKKAARK